MPSQLSRVFPGSLLVLLAAVVVAGSGCSSKGVKKVTVNGTVTYKGQKLQSGLLQFVGDGSYSAASIQPDGTYIMTDVVPGEVKVGIMDEPQSSGSSSGEKAPRPKAAPVALPDKYRHAETSGVTYTITPDTTELNIELK